MKKNQTIFKFVSVRAAETTQNAEDSAYFVSYESQSTKQSSFQKGLTGSDDAKKKESSSKLLKTTTVLNNKSLKALQKEWININNLTKKYGKENKLNEADKQKTAAALSAVMKDVNDVFIADIWDLLIAGSNDTSSLSFDRSKLIHPIRVINIANNRERALGDVKTLKQFLKSTPVIKKEYIKKVIPGISPSKTPKPGNSNEKSVDRVNAIQKALDELTNKKREHKRVYGEVSKTSVTKKQADTKKTVSGVSNDDETPSTNTSRTGNSFVFTESIAKTISKDTLSLVTELGYSLKDRISTIIDGVVSAQQKAVVSATKGKGIKNISAHKGSRSKNPFNGAGNWAGSGGITKPSGTTIVSPKVPSSVGSVKPIGIGDLLLVEEELIKYSMYEIAHVENIMKSEFKERVHRVLEQTEESYLFESETSSETEQDLQKAERYELQKESESVIQSQQTATAGVSVSAGYGPVSAEVSASYSVTNSQEDAVSSSTSYAKEITEQSVSKIIQRTLEQSSVKTLTETEETNTHGFDNKTGEGHVIGIYRFLNKIYRAQVYNYGKRLMFEFMVPEPAAFYKYALTNQTLPGMTVSMPDDEILSLSPTDISRTEYLALVALYQAQSVTPPPAETKYVAKAFYMDYNKDIDYTGLADGEIQVPDGYYADSFNLERVYGVTSTKANNERLVVLVGDRYSNLVDGDVVGDNLSQLTGTVPVVVKTSNLTNWGVTVEIECTLTKEKFEEWQVATYGALLDAYNALKSAYEEALSAAQSEAGVGQYGQSDEMNRVIEQTELKRSCLTLLTDQQFDLFDAMDYDSSTYPEINVSEAMAEGKYVQFFEQAFEWENITYALFPYFWGQKSKWAENINIQNTDTKFQDFLQAGFARVIVPVRPGYDNAILHYTETGEIWEGGETPVIGDELYVSILDELYEEYEEEKIAVGDPWELSVPTNLVYLQTEATLPDLEAEAAEE